MRVLRQSGVFGGLLVIAFGIGVLAGHGIPLKAQSDNRVFELRIATTENKGKLNEVLRRYRTGQLKIWERLGMKGVGFWVPTDPSKSENTVIFILAHESRKAADESWAKFPNDPEWKAFPKPVDLGQVKVERTFMQAVDFSPIK